MISPVDQALEVMSSRRSVDGVYAPRILNIPNVGSNLGRRIVRQPSELCFLP